MERLRSSGGVIQEIDKDPGLSKLSSTLASHQVLLDGILGTGIRLPLRGVIETVLNFVKAEISKMDTKPQVVAVDCPSGVDCDSGDVAMGCIPADLTVTMAAVKQGLLRFPAYEFVGQLQCVGIGLPDGLKAHDAIRSEVVDIGWVRRVFPKRPLDAHKSTFGVVMVLAGSAKTAGLQQRPRDRCSIILIG
jgi:NAD(P)H-hydrate epimerase